MLAVAACACSPRIHTFPQTALLNWWVTKQSKKDVNERKRCTQQGVREIKEGRQGMQMECVIYMYKTVKEKFNKGRNFSYCLESFDPSESFSGVRSPSVYVLLLLVNE